MVMIMTDKTEQKILDSALKLFAKKGYDASTTITLAEESGYSEMTLFRIFKTKKNLFDQVMIHGIKKMQEDAHKNLFIDKKYENPRDFLETYLQNILKFAHDNFELLHLTITEENPIGESFQTEVTDTVTEYIQKNLPNQKIDYRTYGNTITTFVYVLNLEKYHGRTATFGDEEQIIENFIDILYCMINH
jgi:TetR/AcrR family transcriptional regulator